MSMWRNVVKFVDYDHSVTAGGPYVSKSWPLAALMTCICVCVGLGGCNMREGPDTSGDIGRLIRLVDSELAALSREASQVFEPEPERRSAAKRAPPKSLSRRSGGAAKYAMRAAPKSAAATDRHPSRDQLDPARTAAADAPPPSLTSTAAAAPGQPAPNSENTTGSIATAVASASVQPPRDDNPAILEARRLFSEGRVKAARDVLAAGWQTVDPEVTLELARTFDPHYIALLPTADAGFDVRLARALYGKAVSLGSAVAIGNLRRLKHD